MSKRIARLISSYATRTNIGEMQLFALASQQAESKDNKLPPGSLSGLTPDQVTAVDLISRTFRDNLNSGKYEDLTKVLTHVNSELGRTKTNEEIKKGVEESIDGVKNVIAKALIPGENKHTSEMFANDLQETAAVGYLTLMIGILQERADALMSEKDHPFRKFLKDAKDTLANWYKHRRLRPPNPDTALEAANSRMEDLWMNVKEAMENARKDLEGPYAKLAQILAEPDVPTAEEKMLVFEQFVREHIAKFADLDTEKNIKGLIYLAQATELSHADLFAKFNEIAAIHWKETHPADIPYDPLQYDPNAPPPQDPTFSFDQLGNKLEKLDTPESKLAEFEKAMYNNAEALMKMPQKDLDAQLDVLASSHENIKLETLKEKRQKAFAEYGYQKELRINPIRDLPALHTRLLNFAAASPNSNLEKFYRLTITAAMPNIKQTPLADFEKSARGLLADLSKTPAAQHSLVLAEMTKMFETQRQNLEKTELANARLQDITKNIAPQQGMPAPAPASAPAGQQPFAEALAKDLKETLNGFDMMPKPDQQNELAGLLRDPKTIDSCIESLVQGNQAMKAEIASLTPADRQESAERIEKALKEALPLADHANTRATLDATLAEHINAYQKEQAAQPQPTPTEKDAQPGQPKETQQPPLEATQPPKEAEKQIAEPPQQTQPEQAAQPQPQAPEPKAELLGPQFSDPAKLDKLLDGATSTKDIVEPFKKAVEDNRESISNLTLKEKNQLVDSLAQKTSQVTGEPVSDLKAQFKAALNEGLQAEKKTPAPETHPAAAPTKLSVADREAQAIDTTLQNIQKINSVNDAQSQASILTTLIGGKRTQSILSGMEDKDMTRMLSLYSKPATKLNKSTVATIYADTLKAQKSPDYEKFIGSTFFKKNPGEHAKELAKQEKEIARAAARQKATEHKNTRNQ
jgi:hypothetical protein